VTLWHKATDTHEHADEFKESLFLGSKLIGLVRNPAQLAGV
jgi:hypothetical protein